MSLVAPLRLRLAGASLSQLSNCIQPRFHPISTSSVLSLRTLHSRPLSLSLALRSVPSRSQPQPLRRSPHPLLSSSLHSGVNEHSNSTVARGLYSSALHLNQESPYPRNRLYDRATTILTIRRNGEVVVIGDGQVSLGSTVVKANIRKVHKVHNGKVLIGFAGSSADALALMERLEAKLDQYPDQLLKACVELSKDWRMDKYLRQLDARMICVDKEVSLTMSGHGDLMEAQDGIIAIGSGGMYALAAARALAGLKDPELSAREIATKAMNIAADICVYTNHNLVMEVLSESTGTTVAPVTLDTSPPLSPFASSNAPPVTDVTPKTQPDSESAAESPSSPSPSPSSN